MKLTAEQIDQISAILDGATVEIRESEYVWQFGAAIHSYRIKLIRDIVMDKDWASIVININPLKQTKLEICIS